MWTPRLLVAVVALFGLGLLAGPGQAEIDRETAVGIWLFDEGGGSVAKDASGNGNDGTLLPPDNGPQWSNNSKFGKALEFDGTGVYLEFATGENLKTPHFTAMAWFNTRKLDGYGHIFQTGRDWDDMAGYVLRVHQDGTVQAGLAFGPGNTTTFLTGPALEDNTWYHVALTYDGTTVSLYLDGVDIGSGAGQGEIMYDDQPVRIGVHSQDTGAAFDGFIDDVALFDVALEADDIQTIMDRGLADIVGGPPIAFGPQPVNGQTDVPRDPVLGWTPGAFAAAHHVYFSDRFDDVNNGAPSAAIADGIAETSVAPGRLEFDTTYYWRVDEVNAAPDFAVFAGDVWSFTVEPFAYPVEGVVATSNGSPVAGAGPENTVNGSGLNANDEHSIAANDMWLAVPGAEPLQLQYEFDQVYKLHEMLVWNYNVQFELILGFGLKDVTLEYSVDGADWTVWGDAEFAQATAWVDYTANTTVEFGGVAARYVRLTVNSGYSMMGQFGLSEVRFLYIPAQAREPEPADGTTDVSVNSTLSWRAGREAVTHDVYLGTDPNAPALVDSVSEATYVPGDLEFGSTYYWRIDEVNEADEISVWPGTLWDFVTQEYAVIDDMESYNDEEGRIYDTWLDGWVNETSSTVGYLQAPFAETRIVNSGSQSMPLQYDNGAAPFYSEAEKDLGALSLTGNGADTLRLFVSGLAPGFVENADGTILMNGIGNDIWDAADQFRYVYRSLAGNGSMVARVDSLDASPNEWVKAGVMIRQDTSPGSQHSFMPITGGGGNGASWQSRVDEDQASVNADATDPVAAPYWVRIDRAGDSLTGFISADGESWTQLGDPREVVMDAPVLIGLALTSHNVNQATSAQFSNVSLTGNVTGTWEIAEIGATQPEGNTPEPVYVALEDAGGNMAVVTHPDPILSARSGWTEWLIPYTDLGGINLNSIRTIYIGVGDRDNPTAGGEGMIFIDDVGYGKPATVE